MTMKITTHYKEALTSQMLNYKVETMVGENKVVEGFEVSKNNNNITISPGKCIISGAIIESDEVVSVQIPTALQGEADIKVVAQYVHNAKAVNFYVYSISQEIKDTELVLAKLISQEVIAKKMRGLADLSTSLKAIKDSVLADQELEYEGEYITSKESVDGATAELTIKGQTILNVAPIKDEVDVYADLQATSDGSIKFDNTGDGIIDGINIKGKTYQNLFNVSDAEVGRNLTVNSNGYYEFPIIDGGADGYAKKNVFDCKMNGIIKSNAVYTIIIDVINCNQDNQLYAGFTGVNFSGWQSNAVIDRSGIIMFQLYSGDDPWGFRVRSKTNDNTGIKKGIKNIVILEGDHTANPDLPTYFEGIKGVGDKCRNLFNGKLQQGRWTINNGKYFTDNSSCCTVNKITVNPSTQYTFSSTCNLYNVSYYNDNTYLSAHTADSAITTFITPTNCNCIHVSLKSADIGTVFQIEEGSKATPYEKHYEDHKVEVKSCGKNLFNCNWVVGSINQANGMDTDNNAQVRSDGFIEVLVGKTYTFSNNGIIRSTNVFLYDSNFNYISYVKAANRVTIPPGIKYMKLTGNPDNRDMFQIEEGDTAKAYEPYKESKVTHYLKEPLMSLPNGVCDEIVGNKVIKRVTRVTTGAVYNSEELTNTYSISCAVESHIAVVGSAGNMQSFYMSRLNIDKYFFDANDNDHFFLENNEVRFYIWKSKFNSLQDAINYINAEPIEIYLPMAKPIITPLDNDVILPNGVHDQVIGDKAIRNIGQLVLDGSEGWNIFETVNNNDTIAFVVRGLLSSTNANGNNGNFISDKLKFKDIYANSVNNDGMLVHLNEIRISVLKSRLETQDVAGFKKWLSQNPIKIWYELAESYETPADNNIVLPNGVRDEIVDGKVLRKVHKMVIKPENVSRLGSQGSDENVAYFLINPSLPVRRPLATECNILCDSFITVPPNKFDYSKEMVYTWTNTDSIYVHIRKSRLSEVSVEGFKEWVLKNPITVWYEFKEPYYDTVKIPKLNSYKSQTSVIGSTLIPTPLNIESYGYKKEALIKPSMRYTIHFNNKFSDESFKNIKVDLGGAVQNVTANNSWLMLTITTPATLAHNELRISGYGIKVSNVMCSEGSEYREFVDGLAGAGNKSKNLFNPKEAILEYVDSTGGFVVAENNIRTNYLLIKPNTPYIGMSQGASKLNNYSWFDKNKTFIKRDSMEGYAISPNNAMYLIYHNQYRATGSVVDLSSVKIQLEEGTVSTPYEPYYDGHKIEILSYGKNLFDGEWKDGIGIATSTGLEYENPKQTVVKNYIRVKPNTKYFVGNGTFTIWVKGYRKIINKKDTKVIKTYFNNGNTYFETDNDTYFVRVEVALVNKDKVVIISEGEQSQLYEPYQEDKTQILLQEPLHSLPNGVCDTIEKIDGNYVVVRRCGKVILDGRENWRQVNHTRPVNTIYFEIEFNAKSAQILSDKFKLIKTLTGDEEGIIYSSQWNILGIRISTQKAPNLNSFKQWLSENPTTVYYELAAPTIHPLNYLRLPNGVADEIKDGKRIRKVGKVVLDGSEAWDTKFSGDSCIVFDYPHPGIPVKTGGVDESLPIYCDGYDRITNYELRNSDNESLSLWHWNGGGISFKFIIARSKLKTQDVAGFKAWLSENPTTVWYELETPTEEDYNSRNLNLNTYDEVTHITSNTLVPAIINAKIPTNVGAVIKNDIRRIEVIEDLIDKVILPQLVESHYQKTLLEFDYQVSRMLK